MCHINKDHPEECWISVIVRVAMALLFGVAALAKFKGGLSTASSGIQAMFQESWLPSFLVAPYSVVLPFAEALIALWLLSGIKLREAWVFTAFVLVSLAFGLIVVKQNSADIFVYLVTACIGLYFSRYDTCAIGGKK